MRGELDGAEADISQAFKSRHQARDSEVQKNYQIGQRIRLVNCQPFLSGRAGKITALARTKVVVDLDEPCGPNNGWQKGIHVGPQFVEVVK